MWGELVLGGFTLLIAPVIFLMGQSNNIWISHTCFTLFKTLYLLLTAICTFQILSRRCYALVFGVNKFVATVLQSVLTATVINTKPLKLTITSQFLIYASYFAAISLLFTVRGVCTVLRMKSPCGGNQAETASDRPEGSRP
ncbi:thiamine transporter 1-like [Acanthopagrus latus]|uniref:thiamine transporter 1-like n=1 Tax=Acanthopagrus latus TaxID=8177 RepID=UPI00187C3C02|nr:thiamine transporter 1-like [Acanthopagrus latus]